MASVSGCISQESETPVISEDSMTVTPQFPEFELNDHRNLTWQSSDLPNRYVAYFSAIWCTHCKPTLGALDEVIPNGSLLVFNKDGRDGYSNISKWHTEMESGLNRSLPHPFIHAPDIALELNVTPIPTVFFVHNGDIIQRWEGLHEDKDQIREIWDSMR